MTKREETCEGDSGADDALEDACKHGMSAADALHVGCAVVGKADELVTAELSTNPFMQTTLVAIRTIRV